MLLPRQFANCLTSSAFRELPRKFAKCRWPSAIRELPNEILSHFAKCEFYQEFGKICLNAMQRLHVRKHLREFDLFIAGDFSQSLLFLLLLN